MSVRYSCIALVVAMLAFASVADCDLRFSTDFLTGLSGQNVSVSLLVTHSNASATGKVVCLCSDATVCTVSPRLALYPANGSGHVDLQLSLLHNGASSVSCASIDALEQQHSNMLQVLVTGAADVAKQFGQAAIFVAITALFMISGAALAAWHVPGAVLRCVFNHLSAGILTASVAVELVPLLAAPHVQWWATLSGFFAGTVLMLGIKVVTGLCESRAEQDNKKEEEEASHTLPASEVIHSLPSPPPPQMAHRMSMSVAASRAPPNPSLFNRSSSILSITKSPIRTSLVVSAHLHNNINNSNNNAERISLNDDDDNTNNNHNDDDAPLLPVSSTALPSSHSSSAPHTTTSSPTTHTKHFPWAFLLAVAIDILQDGLLIGLMSATSLQAGILMTIALTIEMTFLGMSLSAALSSSSRLPLPTRIIITSLLPLLMFVGALIGSAALSSVPPSSPVFSALIAFGTAALLYLIAEELLPEAHAEDDVDTPFISLAFFVGFIAVLLLNNV